MPAHAHSTTVTHGGCGPLVTDICDLLSGIDLENDGVDIARLQQAGFTAGQVNANYDDILDEMARRRAEGFDGAEDPVALRKSRIRRAGTSIAGLVLSSEGHVYDTLRRDGFTNAELADIYPEALAFAIRSVAMARGITVAEDA